MATHRGSVGCALEGDLHRAASAAHTDGVSVVVAELEQPLPHLHQVPRHIAQSLALGRSGTTLVAARPHPRLLGALWNVLRVQRPEGKGGRGSNNKHNTSGCSTFH